MIKCSYYIAQNNPKSDETREKLYSSTLSISSFVTTDISEIKEKLHSKRKPSYYALHSFKFGRVFPSGGGLGGDPPYEPYVPPHKDGVPPYKIGKLSPLISIQHGGGDLSDFFIIGLIRLI